MLKRLIILKIEEEVTLTVNTTIKILGLPCILEHLLSSSQSATKLVKPSCNKIDGKKDFCLHEVP